MENAKMSELLNVSQAGRRMKKVFLEGPKEMKFHIPALKTSTVPHNNENVTFYLGFTPERTPLHTILQYKHRTSRVD